MQYDSDYQVRLATLGAMGGNTGATYDSVYDIDLEILRLTEQGGGGGGTGTSIDDTVTSTTKTWSSSKISGELAGKQNTLTAGTNVTIQNGVISATDTTYTAGDNISIDNGVISASQPDLSGYATSDDLTNGLAGKQNILTAGTGIQIVNDVISSPSEIDDIHAGSATTYSSNKIIELTQGLGFEVEVVQALPATGDAQTIYMLPKANSGASDVYDEYIYTNNAWEKIGNTQTDLSQYYTKSETDTLLGGKQNTLTAGAGISISSDTISASVPAWQANYTIGIDGSNTFYLGALTGVTEIGNYNLNIDAASGATRIIVGRGLLTVTEDINNAGHLVQHIMAVVYRQGSTTREYLIERVSTDSGSTWNAVSSKQVGVIDDSATAADKVWSSNKVNTELSGKVGSASVTTIWSGTQAAYDLLTKDANTLYFIQS